MVFSNFIKERKNRIACYIFVVIIALLLILIITLFVPIHDDPPIYHYPFMVYIPYSITFNFLLFIVAGIQLRKNEGKFKNLSDKCKTMLKLYDKIEWEEEIPLWMRIVRKISVILLFGGLIAFFFIGFFAPLHLFSPLNMFFLPFVLSALVVWISYGVKAENIHVVLCLVILLGIYISLFILALVIAQDTMIIVITTSYQFIALALILIRLLVYLTIPKKY